MKENKMYSIEAIKKIIDEINNSDKRREISDDELFFKNEALKKELKKVHYFLMLMDKESKIKKKFTKYDAEYLLEYKRYFGFNENDDEKLIREKIKDLEDDLRSLEHLVDADLKQRKEKNAKIEGGMYFLPSRESKQVNDKQAIQRHEEERLQEKKKLIENIAKLGFTPEIIRKVKEIFKNNKNIIKLKKAESKKPYKQKENLTRTEKKLQLNNSVIRAIGNDGKIRLYILDERELGKGSFGRVKKGYDLETGEEVAVKVLTSDKEAAEKYIKAMNRMYTFKEKTEVVDKNLYKEWKSNARREGAHATKAGLQLAAVKRKLTPWYQRTKKISKIYSVQKLLKEKNVAEQFQGENKITDFGVKLKAALAVLKEIKRVHDMNLLHLDIKGENVFFDPKTNTAGLADYGISAELGANKDVHLGNRLQGTPLYLDPEMRLESNMYCYSKATDIYAAGLTLLDIFTNYRRDEIVKIDKKSKYSYLPYSLMRGNKDNLRELFHDDDTFAQKFIDANPAQNSHGSIGRDSDEVRYSRDSGILNAGHYQESNRSNDAHPSNALSMEEARKKASQHHHHLPDKFKDDVLELIIDMTKGGQETQFLRGSIEDHIHTLEVIQARYEKSLEYKNAQEKPKLLDLVVNPKQDKEISGKDSPRKDSSRKDSPKV